MMRYTKNFVCLKFKLIHAMALGGFKKISLLYIWGKRGKD
jgi:hypothetical protein